MNEFINCERCSAAVPTSQIFAHVANLHVARKFQNAIYDFSCSICGFCVTQKNGPEMLDHCYKTNHRPQNITLLWNDFMKNEEERIIEILESGIQILKSAEIPEAYDRSHTDDNDIRVDANASLLTRPYFSPENGGEENMQIEEPNTSNDRESQLSSASRSNIVSDRNNESEMDTEPSMAPVCQKTTCSTCKKELISNGNNRKAFEQQLAAHALTHSDLRFIKCLCCLQELSSVYRWSSHKSRKKCTGEWASIGTVEKVGKLDKLLQKSFPRVNFEQKTSEFSILGSQRQYYDGGRYKYGQRRNPAEKGDCHLCEKNSFPKASWMLYHAISHSGLKLFQCEECELTFSRTNNILRHARKSESCTGNYRSIAQHEDIVAIRQILAEAFPEFDWEKKFPPGSMQMGLEF